ncbi:MAG: hypothetical protein U5L01_12665 [Rheinheimera sp.]|nr:hypothetical protein [Rheinheimera sp.]
MKYTRIAGEQKVAASTSDWLSKIRHDRVLLAISNSMKSDAAAEPEVKVVEESHWLQTGHVVTPEADQHADKEGHLDIYI